MFFSILRLKIEFLQFSDLGLQLRERVFAPGVCGALLVPPEPLAGRGRLREGVPGRRGVERPAALLLGDPLLPPAQAQQHHHQRLEVRQTGL